GVDRATRLHGEDGKPGEGAAGAVLVVVESAVGGVEVEGGTRSRGRGSEVEADGIEAFDGARAYPDLVLTGGEIEHRVAAFAYAVIAEAVGAGAALQGVGAEIAFDVIVDAVAALDGVVETRAAGILDADGVFLVAIAVVDDLAGGFREIDVDAVKAVVPVVLI